MPRLAPPLLLLSLCASWAMPAVSHARSGPACTQANAHGGLVCTIDPATDPGALCNDGTLPAFSYRPGKGDGATTWILWLEGGGSCADAPSCAARAASAQTAPLITSAGFQLTRGQGVLSSSATTNPVLHGASVVLLHYCSSDTWIGDHPPVSPAFDPANFGSWRFAGRRIALADLAAVQARFPAFAQARRILLGGTSAGGVGIVLLANDLLPLLPRIDTLLINDAGFTLRIGQYDPRAEPDHVATHPPFAFDTEIAQRFANWSARGDAACEAASDPAGAPHENCANTAYVQQHRFIHIPQFTAESQLDTAQVTDEICPSRYGVCPMPDNPATPRGMYAVQFGVQMAALVAGGGKAARYSAYAPDNPMHVVLEDDAAFVTALPFGSLLVAPRDALDAFLAAPRGPREVWIGTGPGLVQR